MINHIIEKNRFTAHISETEKRILKTAIRLFLENGYSKTTLRMISAECGLRQGTIAYHFHTKEDMLYYLIQALMDFHEEAIDESFAVKNDILVAYCMEIAVQIALCETDRKAWDLYYAAYSLPRTFEMIKNWAATKNYRLLSRLLPQWTERDFREKEHIASGIELSAFSIPCDKYFTLENKITLVLDSMMLLYHIPQEQRKAAIESVLARDCCEIGRQMFDRFVKRIDNGENDAE